MLQKSNLLHDLLTFWIWREQKKSNIFIFLFINIICVPSISVCVFVYVHACMRVCLQVCSHAMHVYCLQNVAKNSKGSMDRHWHSVNMPVTVWRKLFCDTDVVLCFFCFVGVVCFFVLFFALISTLAKILSRGFVIWINFVAERVRVL